MTDTGILILELLAQFKFLSVSQFEKLGVSLSRKSLYGILKWLRDTSWWLIGHRTFAYSPKYGRLEDMYYLTPKGKKYLISQHNRGTDEIKLPIGNTLFYKDYQHRKTTIDVHIAFLLALSPHGYSFSFYDHYFEGRNKAQGRGRETATAIYSWELTIRADSLFAALAPDGTKKLYAVEVHNGYRVSKISDQLLKHAEVIATGALSKKFGLNISHRVLSVFEHVSTLESAHERLADHPYLHHLKSHFLSKSFNQLITDPLEYWHCLDGSSRTLLGQHH